MRLFMSMIILFFGFSQASYAEKILVAVASNALKAMQIVKLEFEKETGHQLVVSSGSTGKLYAQIINGAPYDVFLAANVREPKKLEHDGQAIAGSRFTYARGRLALCSTLMALDEEKAIQLLNSGKVSRIALANPKTAPYGVAAREVMQKLSVWELNKRKLIKGENISQAYQFTSSGNVELGFVALAQVWKNEKSPFEKCWYMAETYHAPLEQQAVLLQHSKHVPAAMEFIEFVKGSKVRKIFREDFGYGT